jgi:hypothetical protein
VNALKIRTRIIANENMVSDFSDIRQPVRAGQRRTGSLMIGVNSSTSDLFFFNPGPFNC